MKANPELMRVGPYRGQVGKDYQDGGLLASLETIAQRVRAPGAEVLQHRRHLHVRIGLECRGRPLDVIVKCFRRQSWIMDRVARIRGSKAERTWLAASALKERGIGTPAPVAFLDRWEGGRLIESYFLSEFRSNARTFTAELIRLYRADPACWKLMALMQCVADAVKAMHDAGFLHNDLGNQNLFVRRTGDGAWEGVEFIDLNRGEVKTTLSLRERARDLSRMSFPSDLLRIFKEMYFRDVPPAEFQKWEHFYRNLYKVHTRTRWFRHPVRMAKIRELDRGKIVYPSEKDIWIWDERSAQPINVMRPKDRSKHYRLGRHLKIAGDTLKGAGRVWTAYRELLDGCYGAPVAMEGRIGMAIEPRPATAARELVLLEGLGRIPVFLRFYAHESETEWDFTAGVIRDLRAGGHPVSIGLVQNRAAVMDPARWEGFVSRVLALTAGQVEYAEVGHAINRVKWGIWDFEEHRRLVAAAAAAAARQGGVRLMGPAAIDFEYPFVMAALNNLPAGVRFGALSHHLYVDRRGAPENRQGRFAALEKFALARALARTSGVCEDRLIVSEVNWPLRGTGVYSPVTSPYESPGVRFNDPSVSEDEYADYMIRYLLIALCSGMVERVFWWRLVARGFGLVDDTDSGQWRPRPAYEALKRFLALVGNGRFVRKIPAADGVHLFEFEAQDKRKVYAGYSSVGDREEAVPFECSSGMDSTGKALAGAVGGRVRLTGRPVFLFG